MENKNTNPIFYKDAEEMNKPVSQLIEDLRLELARIRGKLGDIKRSYGWGDRIDFAEGGLTCVISALYPTVQELEKFEQRNNKALNNSLPST